MNIFNKADRFVFSERNEAVRSAIRSRIKEHDTREGVETGQDDDGKLPFHDRFEKYPDTPYVINLARGIVDSWMQTDTFFTEGEYFAGYPRPTRAAYEHFSWGILADFEDHEPSVRLKDKMLPLDQEYIDSKGRELMGKEAYEWSLEYLWWPGGYQGHTVPNYSKLLEKGIGGIIDEIDRYDSVTPVCNTKKKNFYEACRIVMKGLSDWLMKLASDAESLADTGNGDLKKQLLEIAEGCRAVSKNAPSDFREAGQLMWAFALWDGADCLGRFDRYMYPFWSGSDEEKYMLADLMLKFWEHGIHNITIGGVTPDDASPAENELTYLILAIIRANHDVHPRVTLRVHDETPDELLQYVTEIWGDSMSDPTVASDKLIIDGLVECGVSVNDARDYTVLGCQEIEIPGKSNFGCEDGVINLAKILEVAMYNGCDRIHGNLQVGLGFGHLTELDTFDKLWNAYARNVEYFAGIFCELCNRGVDIRAENNAKLVKSCLTDACLERGLNLDDGGAVYNYGCIETGGHAAVADSLYAIKTLVYDKKLLSLETLDEALKADFVGFDEVKKMLLEVPKYGNDHDEVDELAYHVLHHFWSEIGRYTTRRGQKFMGACSLVTEGTAMGRNMGAMPDGRNSGEALGNTIGPRTGAAVNGVTSMLTSVAKMPLKLGLGGTSCNVLLSTDVLNSHESRRKVAGVIRTFMSMGGQLAQITAASKEDMLDAQIHPGAHNDLIIRVGGFSKRFNECEKGTQDEVIKRYGG